MTGSRSGSCAALLTLVIFFATPVPTIWAQQAPIESAKEPPQPPSLLREVGLDFRDMFSSSDFYRVVGLGLAGSLGVSPLDDHIATSRFNHELYQGAGLDSVFEAGEILGGSFVQLGAAFAAYGVGGLFDRTSLQGLARELVRAQIVTAGLTHSLKYAVRRERPDGSSRTSFPSGHASSTFATAAVFHRRYGWRVGGPAYVFASYVAASRLSENRHFLSDVVFGAAIGLSGGRAVSWSRGRTSMTLEPMPTPRGVGAHLVIQSR